MPEVNTAVVSCLLCDESIAIVTDIHCDGRVISVRCLRCFHISLFQQRKCLECGAVERHSETCSFATPWGV